jgi:hypothetical protein
MSDQNDLAESLINDVSEHEHLPEDERKSLIEKEKKDPEFAAKMKRMAANSAIVAYNATIGELKNGRIPILDTAYRTFYVLFMANNPQQLFSEERYVPLRKGGKRRKSRRYQKSKKTKNSKRTIRR